MPPDHLLATQSLVAMGKYSRKGDDVKVESVGTGKTSANSGHVVSGFDSDDHPSRRFSPQNICISNQTELRQLILDLIDTYCI